MLAVELLQRSRVGFVGSKVPFPTSEVVQNLSRLLACIKRSVPPTEGNFILCDQARRVIQRILDQVLSTPIQQATHMEEPRKRIGPGEVGPAAVASEDAWLLGARCETDFWMTLPEHPLLQS